MNSTNNSKIPFGKQPLKSTDARFNKGKNSKLSEPSTSSHGNPVFKKAPTEIKDKESHAVLKSLTKDKAKREVNLPKIKAEAKQQVLNRTKQKDIHQTLRFCKKQIIALHKQINIQQSLLDKKEYQSRITVKAMYKLLDHLRNQYVKLEMKHHMVGRKAIQFENAVKGLREKRKLKALEISSWKDENKILSDQLNVMQKEMYQKIAKKYREAANGDRFSATEVQLIAPKSTPVESETEPGEGELSS